MGCLKVTHGYFFSMNLPLQVSDFNALKNCDKPLHLAIGVFDGVHLGHLSVIEPAVSSAKDNSGISAVLTFNPHPSRLFKGAEGTDLIMSLETKTTRLHGLGVDIVIAKTFDKDFASISADAFLSYLLNELPTLKAIYVGQNFRFGQGRVGTIQTLIKSGASLGIDVWSIDRIKQNGLPISSTRIREAMRAGQVDLVNGLLGYRYVSEGMVIKGAQLGTKIGFPTMNLLWSPECKPRYGVYAVRFLIEGSEHWKNGIANFGVRPTVTGGDSTEPLLEVHSLEDCQCNVDDKIRVEWVTFIRDEKQFDSVDALKKQISEDCQLVKGLLSDG